MGVPTPGVHYRTSTPSYTKQTQKRDGRFPALFTNSCGGALCWGVKFGNPLTYARFYTAESVSSTENKGKILVPSLLAQIRW